MFRLLNIDNRYPLAIRVESLNGDSIEFSLKSLKAKRNKEELAGDRQFELLNTYLDYKGKDFKRELYKRIEVASLAVDETVYIPGLSNEPKKAIHSILDMFDIKDIEYYVRDVYKISVPPNLKESFDSQIELDGLGTRIQTYLVQDYYELAAITIPVKAVIGLLGKYVNIKESVISVTHKEYVLYELFLQHPIFDYPAIHKIKDWGKILIESTIPDSDTASITVIEKRIPSNQLPDYLLAVVIIQKLSTAAIVTDTRERNIITGIYNYIINKLRVKADSKSKIRDKKPLSDTDSSDGDKESIIESYRIVSNITIGIEAELNWYTNNIEYLIRDMKYPINRTLLEDILSHNQCFKTIPITTEQVTLAGYLFKNIIDPRALDYIGIDGIINVISLGFTVLWEHNHKELAMLLTAKPVTDMSDTISITTTVNSIRIDPLVKERLAKYYPYMRQVNKTKTVSIVEEAITDLANNIFKYTWLPNAPEYCLKELYGEDVPKLLPNNLKTLLGRLIIDIEENFNNE